MATSAKKEITCGQNNHYHLYMTITVNKQDVSTNKSNVTVKMYAKSDSSSYGAYNLYESENTVKMTVNSSQVVNKTMAMDFRNQATVNMASWTGDITHGSDGKKTLACSGSFTISGASSLQSGSVSCSIVLDDVPRATVPKLSVTTIEIGKALTITTTPAVSGWTHKLFYRFGTGAWTSITASAGTSYAWTVPASVAAKLPDSTSATMTIGCQTFNGSTQIGGTQTVNVKVTVPASMVPTISKVTITEAEASLAQYGYVQGKSKLSIVTTAAGINGSTIKTLKHTIGGQTYTDSSLGKGYTSPVITGNGTVSVITEAVDSRGRSKKVTNNITVLPYEVPQITKFNCRRCTADGTVDGNGDHLKIDMAFSISPLNNKNSKSYAVTYKTASASTWSSIKSGNVYSYSADEVVTSIIIADNLAYDVKVRVSDAFATAEKTARIGTASRLISYCIKKLMLAFGMFPEAANTVDFNLIARFRKNLEIWSQARFTNLDTERQIIFFNKKHSDDSAGTYPHYCKIFAADAGSQNAIGMYDSRNSKKIFEYNDQTYDVTCGPVFSQKVAMGRTNSAVSITSKNTDTKIPLTDVSSTDTAFLVLYDGGIKCMMAGTVLITGQVQVTGLTSGDHVGIKIYRNSNVSAQAAYNKGTDVYASVPERMETVQAGDVIYIYALNYTNAKGTVATGIASTRLTVKYIK